MTGANETLSARPPGLGLPLPGLRGDERLARLAAAGDERAFAAIFRRYGGDLHRYCTTMLGNAADADDALQNTMVSAMRALPGERREIALKPWLFRVAHNEAISLLRARRPVAELDPDRLAAPGADTTHAATERLRRLVGDLQHLPERQRGALVMRELNGMSFEELGESLGCSPASARQALYEARLALQEISEGREMQCNAARQAISERDGRMLRGRKLRAHLGECERCRDFRAAIFDRRDDLAQLAPPLALPAVLGLLKGVGVAGGAAGAGTGLTLGGSAAVKAATAALAAGAIGAGAAQVGIVDLPVLGRGDAPAQRQATTPGGAERSTSGISGAHAGPSATRPGPARAERGSSATAPGRAGRRESRGRPPAHARGAGQAAAPAEAPATPPGQAATPPGQASVPPGQSQTPPGHSASAPSHSATAPGQLIMPPGQSHTAPGQLMTPPGQSQAPPGQTKPEHSPPPAPAANASEPSPQPAPADPGKGSGPPAHAQNHK